MPEQIQINKIENGYLVAYPETPTIQDPRVQAQPKMCCHYCATIEDVASYISTLNK